MKPNIKNYTVLEVLIVVFIIGFFAAMIVPMLSSTSTADRVDVTQQQLDAVARMLLGENEKVAQADSTVLQRGYVADMGELPRLYYGEYSAVNKAWFYTDANITAPNLAFYTPQTDTQFSVAQQAYYVNWSAYTSKSVLSAQTVNSQEQFLNMLLHLQPVALWEERMMPSSTDNDADDFWVASWAGPYAKVPEEDRYKDTSTDYYDTGTFALDNHFLMRSSEKRLADAWGHNLIFFPYYNADDSQPELWIISAGPDGRVEFGDGGTVFPGTAGGGQDDYVGYDDSLDVNRDNIVRRITVSDWKGVVETREEQARQDLLAIRKGMLGNSNARDLSNRRQLGGFIGAVGRFPHFYRWYSTDNLWLYRYRFDFDNATPQWIDEQWDSGTDTWIASAAAVEFDPQQCFPRGLWTRDPVTDGDADNDIKADGYGIGWGSAYITAPKGKNEFNYPLDPWGRPYYFYMDKHNTLWVFSAGADGCLWLPGYSTASGSPAVLGGVANDPSTAADYDVSAEDSPTGRGNADNIFVRIDESEWSSSGEPGVAFRVEGSDLSDVRARIYLSSYPQTTETAAETYARFDEFDSWTVNGENTAWEADFTHHVLSDFSNAQAQHNIWNCQCSSSNSMSTNTNVDEDGTAKNLSITGDGYIGNNGISSKEVYAVRTTGSRFTVDVITPGTTDGSTEEQFIIGLATSSSIESSNSQLSVVFLNNYGGNGLRTLGFWDGSNIYSTGQTVDTWDVNTTYRISFRFTGADKFGIQMGEVVGGVVSSWASIYPNYINNADEVHLYGPNFHLVAQTVASREWKIDNANDLEDEVVDDFDDGKVDTSIWDVWHNLDVPPTDANSGVLYDPTLAVDDSEFGITGNGNLAENAAVSQKDIRRVAGKRITFKLQMPEDGTVVNGDSFIVGLTQATAASGLAGSEGLGVEFGYDGTAFDASGWYNSGSYGPASLGTFDFSEKVSVAIEFGSDSNRDLNLNTGFKVFINGSEVFDSDNTNASTQKLYQVFIGAVSGGPWLIDSVTEKSTLIMPQGMRELVVWEDTDDDAEIDDTEYKVVRKFIVDKSGIADRKIVVTMP